MARYIDADWIYEKVENRYRLSSGIEHRCERDLLDLICSAPTADVVPKSEVDTWYQLYHSIKEELKLEKMYHRETENLCDRYCIESQQAKKQVAREIFEEIEKLSYRFMNDKHYIFGDMVWDIAELKKKYTEGKDEQASIQTDHKEDKLKNE